MGAKDRSEQLPDGLRERAVEFGLASLADADVLELFLVRSLATGARTWAQVLLNTWQSLSAVLGADVSDLAAVIGVTAAVDLKLIHEATLRVLEGSVRKRDVLSSSTYASGGGRLARL